MSQGSIFNCKNHPGLRWFNTKPNGQLVFMGELTEEGLKQAAFDPQNPLIMLKHYLNGKNPYWPESDLETPFTYERLKGFMRFVLVCEEQGYVFECECPFQDLQRLTNETYESVHAKGTIAPKN
jgi:hypothetical protein